MNPVTHLLVGWVTAETAELSRRDRAFVALAGVVPDVDGAGILVDFATGTPPAEGLYGAYHHVVAHGAAAAVLVTAVTAICANRRLVAAALACVAFHLHILGDLVGSAGPGGSIWSLAYLWPVSDAPFAWQGQWELNAWPNIALTVVLLGVVAVLGVRRGRTPVELLSLRADAAVTQALRARFPSSPGAPQAKP